MKKLNHIVFWPPVLLLVFSLVLSLVDPEKFQNSIESINKWLLVNFDTAFSWGTFGFLILVLIAYFSKLGSYKIGGKEAKPLLNRWQLFSITLCTTIATGILFWGCAEPLFHSHAGPEVWSGASSKEGFTMGTLYMHWSFTPYAIYCLIGLVFAIMYYKGSQPYSIEVVLEPVFSKKLLKTPAVTANIIILFALVAGMAASLGAGILTISGGLNSLYGIKQGFVTNGIVALSIVSLFVLSAASGLFRGIKWLSQINTFSFIAIAIFILITGPWQKIIHFTWIGLEDFISTFVSRSTLTAGIDEAWIHDWTIFNWANWLAWAPVTAMFLGKIAKGYTVRSYIQFNFILPALFGILWMSIFGGSVLHFDQQSGGEYFRTMTDNGVQSVVYTLLGELPFASFLSTIFLLTVFISFVTAADSNTTALSGISSLETSESESGHFWIKLTWGLLIGAISFIMITYSGIDGIRILSVIGGFPVLFLMMIVSVALVRLIINSYK